MRTFLLALAALVLATVADAATEEEKRLIRDLGRYSQDPGAMMELDVEELQALQDITQRLPAMLAAEPELAKLLPPEALVQLMPGYRPPLAKRHLPAGMADLPGVDAFELVIARFIDRDPRKLKATYKGSTLDGRCSVGPEQETVLPMASSGVEGYPPRAFVGDHITGGCRPFGLGRIDYANGDRWIGEVNSLQVPNPSGSNKLNAFHIHAHPVPNGVGWYRTAAGLNLLVELRQTGGECYDEWFSSMRLIEHIATFDDAGRHAIFQRKFDQSGASCDDVQYENEAAAMLGAQDAGTLSTPAGVAVRGQISGLLPVPDRAVVMTDATNGLTLVGRQRAAGAERRWTGRVHAELTRAAFGLGAGNYAFDAETLGSPLVLEPGPWLSRGSPTTANAYAAAMRDAEGSIASEVARYVAKVKAADAARQAAAQAAGNQRRLAAKSGPHWTETLANTVDAVSSAAAPVLADRKAQLDARQLQLQQKAKAQAAQQAAQQGGTQAAPGRQPASAPDSSPSAGGYALGASPSSRAGSTVARPDTAKIDRCAQLSRDIMSAKSDFHCNMNGKEFPSIGARRDAEKACYDEVAAKVAPLRAEYSAQCSSKPTDGGVTRQ